MPRCCTLFNIYAFWCIQQHFSEEIYKAALYKAFLSLFHIAIEEPIKIENVYLVFSVKCGGVSPTSALCRNRFEQVTLVALHSIGTKYCNLCQLGWRDFI